MYGRNLLRGGNGTTGNTNGTGMGNSSSGNIFGGRSNDTNSQQSVGSNRLSYTSDQLPSGLVQAVKQWNGIIPYSIVCRPQTLHLSTLEFRIEDYYLIRSGKVSNNFQQRVNEAVRNGSLNEELMKQQPRELFKYSSERGVDLNDGRMGGINGGTANDSGNGRGGNAIFGNSNSNNSGGIFGKSPQGNNSSVNVFSGNNSNNRNSGSTNVFSNGGNVNRSNTGQNIFGGNSSAQNNSSGGNSNNIFNSQNKNTSSNNVFGGNNSNGGNSNNNSSNNTNIFNKSSGNSGSNGNSGNIFNTGGQNTSGNNIFSNNNSNNNNNNSNNSGGNIFNNGNNNNRGNNSGGNNLFGNSGGSSQGNTNTDMSMMINAMQMYFHQNQIYMQKMLQNRRRQQSQCPQPQEELVKCDLFRNEDMFLFDDDYHNRWQRKRREEQAIIIMPKLPKQSRYYMRKQHQQSNDQHEGFATMPLVKPAQSQLISNTISPKNNGTVIHQRASNKISNPSMRISNGRGQEYSSMIYSRCNATMNGTKRRENTLLVIDGRCKCKVIMDICWLQEKVEIKSKQYTVELELQDINLQCEQGREKVWDLIKRMCQYVRNDAVFKPDFKRIYIDASRSEITVNCKVEQRIINLSMNYQVYFSMIKNGLIFNLTITNRGKGTIAWDIPIRYQTLDFQRDEDDFFIQDCQVVCNIPELNGRCRVTFNKYPQNIQRTIQKHCGIEQAKIDLQKYLKSLNSEFQFGDLWYDKMDKADGGWCFIARNGLYI